jgi:hypothetical protein
MFIMKSLSNIWSLIAYMKNDHGDVGIVQLHLGMNFLPYIW